MASTAMYVQYGAGLCGPSAWVNFDVSPTLRLQRLPAVGPLFSRIGPAFPRTVRYGDIVAGLPIARESCAAIYCSHVLEHLTLVDLRTALANTHAYLRPGGRFRLVLPDLEQLARSYIANPEAGASISFMNDSRLGEARRPRGLGGMLRSVFGHTAHLWMWDYKSLRHELESVGFRDVRRAAFGDSGDAMFDVVEDPERWHESLGMECFRPPA